ncbi:MAG TPA: hypothetical protein VEK08_17685 [Planctomycetota bacterium]|nr:hypothetical protein [Planctomycetota bacterium]
MKSRFNIVKLEERIAPALLFPEFCPPGLEKKAGSTTYTGPVEVQVDPICGCVKYTSTAADNSTSAGGFENIIVITQGGGGKVA